MNFFKQAQEMAASANVNTENQGEGAPAGGASGGLGGFMSEAQDMVKAQGAPAEATGQSASGEATSLPGGRHQAPTNAELMESSKLLFGAAQGEKVDNKRLAGAAEDLLGGLAAHGKLDQGQYGSYINQAEQYLHKYAGEDSQAPRSAPGSAPPDAASAPPPASEDQAQ